MNNPTFPPDKSPCPSWSDRVAQASPAEVEAYLIDEIFRSLGLRTDSRWRAWFGPIFTPIARGLSHKAFTFDLGVAQHGFKQTAQEWLSKLTCGLQIVGKEQVPPQGSLLIAANHPGTFDGLAIASAIPRQDLKIVVSGNPFFRLLPNTRKYFIYATRDTHERMTTIRNALRHLQAGGALLIFPGGTLEPDPLYYKNAAKQSLKRWSASLKLMLSKASQTKFVLAINSGFVAPEYIHNPLARLYAKPERRQKIAEVLQVINQVIFNRQITEQPRISFSEPISASQLDLLTSDIQAQILSAAAQLLDST